MQGSISGVTALHYAAAADAADCARSLILHNADVVAVDSNVCTAHDRLTTHIDSYAFQAVRGHMCVQIRIHLSMPCFQVACKNKLDM